MTKKQIDALKDEADNQIDSDTPDKETIGSLLKQSREKMGISIADIAGQLHLRPCIVEDIEADKFEQIASPIYVKGYVKNFARIVQADSKAIQRCLANQIPKASAPEMQSFSRKTTRQARDGRLMFVTYLIAFILLGLLVLWWVQKSDTLSAIDFSKPTVEEIADSSVADVREDMPNAQSVEQMSGDNSTHLISAEPRMASISSSNDFIDNRLDSSDAIAIDEAVGTLVSEVVIDKPMLDEAVNVNQNSSSHSTLLLTLSGDCWINVTDASGKVLINDLEKSGSRLNVSGEAPFKLTLGAPQVVNIELNGQAVSLSDYSSGRVARLTLPSAS